MLCVIAKQDTADDPLLGQSKLLYAFQQTIRYAEEKLLRVQKVLNEGDVPPAW